MLNQAIISIRSNLKKIQPALLWLIAAYLSYRLMLHGYLKFDPEGFWTNAFNRWGYPAWFRVFIGVLEVTGGALLLVPRVRHFGAIILFIVMVGALITRIVFGTSLDDALSIAFNATVFLYMIIDHSPQEK